MWLINTTTLKLQSFPQAPAYVALSHRWGSAEMTYEEHCAVHGDLWQRGTPEQVTYIKAKAGYEKMVRFCHFGRSRGHEWAWVDTCCIDKRSSAELSEAINSMWRWYEEATECVVYLNDVPELKRGINKVTEAFKQSKWFTRCWTLQELLAPSRLLFCNRSWEPIRDPLDKARWTSSREGLARELAAITGIPSQNLEDPAYNRSTSVAGRMSWAARREATRPEDVAYSLLGLFDINMPLIYGEGEYKAFMRLQKEIIRQSDDESVFAWRCDPCRSASEHTFCGCTRCSSGLLARRPRDFRDSGSIQCFGSGSRPPYTITKKGLDFSANTVSISVRGETLDTSSAVSVYGPSRDSEEESYTWYIVKLNCCEGMELRPCYIALQQRPRLSKDVQVTYSRAVSYDLGERLITFAKGSPRKRWFYICLEKPLDLLRILR